MPWRRRSSLVLGVLVLLGSRDVVAQGIPVVTGVFPAGATVGSSIDWTISGRSLARVKNLVVSGRGVEVVTVANPGENSVTARIRVSEDAEPGFREVRLEGPSGVSNLAIVRIDRLRQVLEAGPNQEIDKAQAIEPGTAVAGVLNALDQDHYRIRGKPGQKLTIDLEARRLGTAIMPVVTLFNGQGGAIAQGRGVRGLDQDCRMAVTLPADGVCVVQVRDGTYGGNDQARYRLRVDPSPFATAVFPVGGAPGQTIDLEVAGGSLAGPLHRSITLPATPGSIIEPGSVAGPDGPVAIPGRIIVGDGPEIVEPADRQPGSSVEVQAGLVVNGRISQPGDVDSYRLAVKAGEKIRIRVEAAALGSWLDSVIVLRDADGETVAENDDTEEAIRPIQARSVNGIGIPEDSPDSSLEYEAEDDEILTIEVVDRFGEGGPEYPYRLKIGQDRPDFAVTLLLGNATAKPGQYGVFNLKPGGSVPINFVVVPDGRPGLVELTVEGLPEGATADPVAIRFPGSKSPPTARADPVADFIQVKVASFAQPGLGEIRIVARSKPAPGVVLVREAAAVIGIDVSNLDGRPVTRVVNRIPFRILGETKPPFVGPPAPPKLLKLSGPNQLLQGDQLDLKLEFDGIVTADDGSTIEGRPEGAGLATNTVYPSASSTSDDDRPTDLTFQVLASITAPLGPQRVKVGYTTPGGLTTTREVTLEIKVPIEVRPLAETIFLRPGDQASFPVEIRRESGFEGEVEIKLEGLPGGIKRPPTLELGPGKSTLEVRLEMEPDAKPIETPVGLRVVGMARMPRGNVSVESKIRPMIAARPADK